MKEKVRAILDRNKLTPNAVRPIRLKQFIHGWVNDFKLIDMKQLLMEVDTWIRRKILGNLLETVEEGANKVPHDTPLRDSRMESA